MKKQDDAYLMNPPKTVFLVVLSAILLLGATCLSQVTTMPQREVDAAAEEYWDDMTDHYDLVALDQFLSRYPTSRLASLAFMLRYSLVVEQPTIDGYRDFLKEYPNQPLSMRAMHELFELYKAENRATGYVDFINRYPDSQHAAVARMRLEALMFQFVSMVDEEDEYDAFIETFPDAPQVPLVADLAEKRVLADEKKRYEAIMADDNKYVTTVDGQEFVLEGTKREKRDEMAWTLVNTWGTLNAQLDDDLEKETANNSARLYRIKRHANAILHYYRGTQAASNVRVEERHRALMKKLTEIQQTMVEQNDKLIKSIRDESRLVRDEIRKGIDRLVESNRETQAILQKGFTQIEKAMDKLHDDLEGIHKEIVGLRNDVRNMHKDLHAVISETNRKLAELDDDLRTIYQGLCTINDSIQTGFSELGRKVDHLTDEVRVGFENVNRLQMEQINVSNQILDATHNLTGVVQNGFGTLANIAEEQLMETRYMRADMNEGFHALREGQERQLYVSEQILGMTYTIADNQVKTLYAVESGFQTVNSNINRLDKNMQAGFKKIDQSIWKSSDMMRKDIQQMSTRIESQIKAGQTQSSGGGGSKKKKIFGKILGGLAGTASSFIPGVGPIVAPFVATAVTGLVEGKSGKEVLKETAGSMAEKYAPGTGDIVTSALNKDFEGAANATINYVGSKIEMPESRQLINAATTTVGSQPVLRDDLKKVFIGQPPIVPKAIDSLLALDRTQRKSAVVSAATKFAGEKGLPVKYINAISAANSEQQLQAVARQIEKDFGINPNVIMFAVDYIQ